MRAETQDNETFKELKTVIPYAERMDEADDELKAMNAKEKADQAQGNFFARLRKSIRRNHGEQEVPIFVKEQNEKEASDEKKEAIYQKALKFSLDKIAVDALVSFDKLTSYERNVSELIDDAVQNSISDGSPVLDQACRNRLGEAIRNEAKRLIEIKFMLQKRSVGNFLKKIKLCSNTDELYQLVGLFDLSTEDLPGARSEPNVIKINIIDTLKKELSFHDDGSAVSSYKSDIFSAFQKKEDEIIRKRKKIAIK